uniref:Phosphotransferase n=1 Tax=Ananas comosus var. bracteatus TaxID=296719 RepID=A0A6V7QA73_ANACO|nr:unnamed protein product [Ananas comosus var. bracteatus]
MVVNMEWGNFWSSHLPRTSYDIALDEESPNRNDQARAILSGFEKMISGMYLGEVVRRVLQKMAQESDLFVMLLKIYLTPIMAAMHEDDSPDLERVRQIMEQNFQMPHVPLKTRRLIIRRKIEKQIAEDVRRDRGGLYTGYSNFRDYLNEAVVEILGEEVARNVILRVSEDGSGIGAALLAAAHSLDR